MFKIIERTVLSANEFQIWLSAPRIAMKAQPGQFIILRINEYGERIPLTICEADATAGTLRIIFQVIGKSTAELAQVEVGSTLLDVVGPLGKPTVIKHYGTVLLVGGGVGIAALFPIIKGLKQAGNHVITIIGAKTAGLLILQEECAHYSDELILVTDDGSVGHHGLVTEPMKKVLQRGGIAVAWAIGPSVMMKYCTQVAMQFDVPIYVSLNPIMVDGTGMCGGCRVMINNQIKFACVDGPEFLGAEVDWNSFIQRMHQYHPEEVAAYQAYQVRQVH